MQELMLHLQDEEWPFTYTKVGRLLANRELPILRQAKRIIDGDNI